MEKIAGTTVGFARRKTTNREAERCTRPKKNTDGDTTMAGHVKKSVSRDADGKNRRSIRTDICGGSMNM
ncbi:hypothetical protein GQ600_22576 [Phytophthora cactorum]|nr:hypothetical protein GQ600_22576 [Phytophthora cactorum]